MCGILGFVPAAAQVESIVTHRFGRALDSLRHRGPDNQGQYQDGKVWLGHNRLSILDLSAAGCQPMHSDGGRYVITYNGEVYNFRELAARHRMENLRSNSDTEVILRMFEKLGVGALPLLNGMFAFCLYDRELQKLWLVRDRLGIKPLYFMLNEGGFVFASEIKAILALSDDSVPCNVSALSEWLYYGNTLGGRTLYAGIQQLLPGHYLELDLRSVTHEIHEYWSVDRQASAVRARVDTRVVIDDVRRLLEEAVRRQLISDVPVGVFLSGGVDSSAITAFASRHYEGRLATYSVGFDFSVNGGELPRAKRVARQFGTDHHEIHIGGQDVGDLVEKMVSHHDMPFADAANIPLYLMAAQIRENTKVVLQGDGGDELFCGYRRYATLKYHKILRPLARALQHIQGVMPKSPLGFRITRYMHAFAAEDLPTTMALLLSPEDRRGNPSAVFSPAMRQFLSSTDPFARYRDLFPLFDGHDIGNTMSFLDLSIILPDTYLEKVDRSTMAASLEVRVPFLDHDLVDYVVQLKGTEKMPFGKKKWLLKCALRDIVPDEVLDGPKTGFNVPFGRWLQTSLKPVFFDHLNRFARRQPEVLDVAHIRALFARTNAGVQDHSPLLWKMLNFMVWANGRNIELTTSSVS